MKQNKKGFTLIELLAVIVILAIIALIAVPVIMNIISSARKSAFEDTAYGIIKAGELYYASSLLNDGMTGDAEFTFNNGAVSPTGLSIQGSLPQSGKLVVTTDGKTAIAISNGTYCITKGYDESKITTTDEFESCDLPAGTSSAKTLKDLAKTNDFATTVNACATDGICAAGTKFAIEVAPGDIKNFYVVSDVDNAVTLIMDRNIGDPVAWINQGDYEIAGGTAWDDLLDNNTFGPITALNYLENQTSGWINVGAKNYTLTDSAYGPITRTNTRARMLTKTEAIDILGCMECLGCAEDDAECVENNPECPIWLYGNLDQFSYGYWTSSSLENYGAWLITNEGFICDGDGDFGVRPVIEILK